MQEDNWYVVNYCYSTLRNNFVKIDLSQKVDHGTLEMPNKELLNVLKLITSN